jgi:hypothetical protein
MESSTCEITAFDQYGNDELLQSILAERFPILPGWLCPPRPTPCPTAWSWNSAFWSRTPWCRLRGLAGNPTALMNFLSSNAAPKMEVFRQRVTIAAAPR